MFTNLFQKSRNFFISNSLVSLDKAPESSSQKISSEVPDELKKKEENYMESLNESSMDLHEASERLGDILTSSEGKGLETGIGGVMSLIKMSKSPETAGKLLDQIARREITMERVPFDKNQKVAINEDIYINIAQHPNVLPETLKFLAKSEMVNVRVAVAANINTPEDVLKTLVEDKDQKVRFVAEENPATPFN